MAQPNLIPMPWAENGQKQDPIPAEQTSAGNGRASWKTGFPIENTRPVSNGGVPANYQDFQGVLHTLSEFACYQQAGGIFTWSDELDYEVGARVLGSDNNVYVAIANNGPSSVVTDPVDDTSGKWVTEPNITQASAAALEVASGFVTSGGYTINNGFTVTGGVINGQITSAQYASAIGNTSTNIGAAATPVYVSGGVVTSCGGVAVTSSAQTFSGEKTFTSVISGGVTGNAGTATRLQTARNIQTNLANTSAASFNGTANITPGVTGTLAVANGGTGVTTIANIQAGKDGAGNTITSTYATKADVAEEMATKADIDGNYPDMTVGNAEQLVSEDYITDTAPYTFRTAGGNVDIGDREYDELVGGTIAWNQKVNYSTCLATLGSTTVSDGVITYTPSSLANNVYQNSLHTADGAIPIGHKYLFFAKVKVPIASTSVYFYIGGKYPEFVISTANTWTECSTINEPNSTATNTFGGVTFKLSSDAGYTTSSEIQVKDWQIFDLTAMFGTAIADYIYTLEQATAGAGVAWFRTLFPKNYYAYNAGSLMSVQAASHDMVGFNQLNLNRTAGTLTGSASDNTLQRSFEFDKYYAGLTSNNYYNTAYVNSVSVDSDSVTIKTLTSVYGVAFPVKVFPQTTYYIKMTAKVETPAIGVGFYDGDGNPIGFKSSTANATFETPENCYIATIIVYSSTAQQLVTATDLNLNLSWSGYRNGEYEPYQKNSYPLDASLTLRGIPKLDISNNLYYDGDTYAADGTVTRRYGIVDLGTLTYTKSSSGLFTAYVSGIKTVLASNELKNIITTRYVQITSGAITGPSGTNPSPDMVFAQASNSTGLYFNNLSYTDTAAFKAAMSGVYLVYELATSTTETADVFQSPQIVNDFGTEQYVDAAVAAGTRDVAIPVGHDTRYMSNLKDKLRHLPNIPDTAGTYLVYYDGTTRRMSCTEYLDGAKVTALEGKVPDAPAEDGTYTLTATVADGEVTYSWVSAE